MRGVVIGLVLYLLALTLFLKLRVFLFLSFNYLMRSSHPIEVNTIKFRYWSYCHLVQLKCQGKEKMLHPVNWEFTE